MASAVSKVKTIFLEGSDNYDLWALKTELVLMKDGLEAAISDQPNELTEQQKKNARVIIQLSLEKGPLWHTKDLTSAKDIWTKLQQVYKPKGFSSELLILKEFFNAHLSDFDTIEQYLDKVKLLHDELRSKNLALPDKATMAWILNSLTEEYDVAVQAITQAFRGNPEAYTLDDLISSLIDESRALKHRGDQVNALGGRRNWRGNKHQTYCTHCKGTSHTDKDCYFLHPNKAPKGWKDKKNKVTKNSKKKKGGKQQKKGDNNSTPEQQQQSKPAAPSKREEREQKQADLLGSLIEDSDDDNQVNTITMGPNQELLTGLTKPIEPEEPPFSPIFAPTPGKDMEVDYPEVSPIINQLSEIYITDRDLDYLSSKKFRGLTTLDLVVDTGATVHTIANKNYLFNYRTVNRTVKWGQAKSLTVTGIGDLKLKCIDTGRSYTIKNVLFIPELGINLLSVSKLKGCYTLIDEDIGLKLFDKPSRQLITRGYHRKGLYYIPFKVERSSEGHFSILTATEKQPAETNLLKTWHSKLGHISLKPLAEFLVAKRLKVSKADLIAYKKWKCEVCLQATQRRHIHKNTANQAEYTVLQRVHSDIGGPLPLTYDRYKYYITFLDKKSRFLEIKLLKAKSEALEAFNTYKLRAENQCNTRIKEFFTDNGTEYTSTRFEITLSSNGIIHHRTPTYTKEPNGFIERINLTLMNKVRAFLIASGLPNYLWGEALLAAAYLYNRTPHKSLGYKTPFEIYYGHIAYTDHLTSWGSIVYYNTNQYKTKLEPRTRKGVVIGFGTENPHYKIWDLQGRKALWSRDVDVLDGQYIQSSASSAVIKANPKADSLEVNAESSDSEDEAPERLTPYNQNRGNSSDQQPSSSDNAANQPQVPANLADNFDYRPISTQPGQRYNTRSATKRVTISEPEPQGDRGRPPKTPRPNRSINQQSTTTSSSALARQQASTSSNTSNQGAAECIEVNTDQLLLTVEDTLLSTILASMDLKDKRAAFILSVATAAEPSTFKRALQAPDFKLWLKACNIEVRELEGLGTYTIVDLPPGKTAIGTRWLFKAKPITDILSVKPSWVTNAEKTIRYKARFIVQGYTQQLGVDYLETFSTTARPETWHLILIIAVNKGWSIIQFDVQNAFVHSDIDQEIYIRLPEGQYPEATRQGKVAKLNKALYGLKQSPRLWYKHLAKVLKAQGFTVFPYDEGVFINSQTTTIIICHVDDLLIINPTEAVIDQLAEALTSEIKLDRIGPVATYLGNDIGIDRATKAIRIQQKRYTEKLLQRFGIYDNKEITRTDTPIDPKVKLVKFEGQASKDEINRYQQQIGSLLYLALKTRPDITFGVCLLARFMANPGPDHFTQLNKLWGYLLQHPDLGIIYNCEGDLALKVYSDSDWASDPNQRRSTGAYIASLGDSGVFNPISWVSQILKAIALSSCEAEYMALREALKEAVYLSNMFQYLNSTLNLGYSTEPPAVFCDNTGAIKTSENPEFHKRMKHIDLSFHYNRSIVANKQAVIHHVNSADQLADYLTKPLPRPLFTKLVRDSGVTGI